MPTSVTISLKELQNLKKHILKTGLKKRKPTNEYELLRVENGNIKIVVYKSGKLVYNDTVESARVIDEILDVDRKYTYFIGSDEVGKGEWYGPLVVGCVALEPSLIKKFRKMGAKDSKSMDKKQLLLVAGRITKETFVKRITPFLPETYNRLYEEFQKENKTLNELLAWAHSSVIRKVLGSIRYESAKLVIDKFDVEKTYRRLYGINNSKIKVIQKSKGESETPVAVASILAKVRFEELVDNLNEKYNIDLRQAKPEDLDPKILRYVAKLHFKNVKKVFAHIA